MNNLLSESQETIYNRNISLIADSYKRMPTNRDTNYRVQQLEKCEKWLEEMTVILEEFYCKRYCK